MALVFGLVGARCTWREVPTVRRAVSVTDLFASDRVLGRESSVGYRGGSSPRFLCCLFQSECIEKINGSYDADRLVRFESQ